jgi:hypothetical protein
MLYASDQLFQAIIATTVNNSLNLHVVFFLLDSRLIRAILMPSFFVIFSFFSVWFYNAAPYLGPIEDLYEAFALVALFFYMNLIILPEAPRRTLSFYGGDLSYLQQFVPNGDLSQYAVSFYYNLHQKLCFNIFITELVGWCLPNPSRPHNSHNCSMGC